MTTQPTLLEAKAFFGILDTTWNQMRKEEQQSYVNEITETPKFLRIFKIEKEGRYYETFR